MLICLKSLHPINIKIHTCILALRLRMAARRVCFHLITAMAHREARGIIACAICSNISQKNYPVNVHSESVPARHTWRYMLISHVCSGPADGKATTNGGGFLLRSRFTFTFSSFSRPPGSILTTKLPLSGASSDGNQ